MSATDRTRHDADVAARLAAWHAAAATDTIAEDSAQPEHVERYLRELAAALDTFITTAGVDVIARGYDDPLSRAVTGLFLDAFQRGLRQGRGERPETFLGFLQVLLRRATRERGATAPKVQPSRSARRSTAPRCLHMPVCR